MGGYKRLKLVPDFYMIYLVKIALPTLAIGLLLATNVNAKSINKKLIVTKPIRVDTLGLKSSVTLFYKASEGKAPLNS